jgi:hypothetical protein
MGQPNWAALWEREPGLRPIIPANRTDTARIVVAPASGESIASVAGTDGWWGIPDEWMAALCRDAAVLFLLRCGRRIVPSPDTTVEEFTTRLYSACEAVLDTRVPH